MKIFKPKWMQESVFGESLNVVFIVFMILLNIGIPICWMFNLVTYFKGYTLAQLLSLLVMMDGTGLVLYLLYTFVGKAREERVKDLIKQEQKHYGITLSYAMKKYKKKKLPIVVVGDGVHFKTLDLNYSLYLKPSIIINKGRLYLLMEPIIIDDIAFYFFVEEGASVTLADQERIKTYLVNAIHEIKEILKENPEPLLQNEVLREILEPYLYEENSKLKIHDQFFINLETDEEFATNFVKTLLENKCLFVSKHLVGMNNYLRKFNVIRDLDRIHIAIKEWEEHAQKYARKDLFINMLWLAGAIIFTMMVVWLVNQFFNSLANPELANALNKLSNVLEKIYNQTTITNINLNNTTINQTINKTVKL